MENTLNPLKPNINNEKLLLWSLLGILVAITLYPITQIGLLTGDDLEYFICSGSPDSWSALADYYAKFAGRFNFYLVKWVYYLPYLVDNALYYQS